MAFSDETIVIMVWFIMGFSALCSYKLYKLYCRRDEAQQALPTSDIEPTVQDRTPIRTVPVFKSLLPYICRAGESVSLQITSPDDVNWYLAILIVWSPSFHRQFPGVLRNHEMNAQLQNHFTSQLSVKICPQNSVSNPSTSPGGEMLPIIFEYPAPEEGQHDVILLIKFTVRQAGLYHLDLKYQNCNIRGTPFLKPFSAGKIDSENTVFQRKSPAILCVTDTPNYCIIEPRDRYNNVCNIEDVDLDQFSVRITEIESRKKGELVEPVTYNFSEDSNDWGVKQQAVRLQMELFRAGVFLGTIYYNDSVIQNGTFEIICVTPQENDKFRSILLENPGAVYHEANLVYIGLETATPPLKNNKQRKVYVYVAPQVLSVKEYYFGIIPTQLASYRVIPATRIQLILIKENESNCVLSFSDRMQPKLVLEMDTSLARIVIAMFIFFLQQRLGGSETFENKQRFFHQELRKVLSDKNRASTAVINISRTSLVESTLKETKIFGAKDWCRKFKIRFIGEEGADEGGLRREWLDLVCRQLFDSSPRGMFHSLSNSRLVLPNPIRDPAFTLRHYELAGRIVGKCMFETSVGGHFKQMVNGRFGRSFLAQIIGFPPHYKYFEQDDPELYDSKVRYILDSSEVGSMDLTFSEEIYVGGKLLSTVDLIPNGANVKVTNENKLEYLQAMAHYRLSTRIRKEIESFIKGLNDIVPFGLLTNFDENELEILMCGQSTINVEDLKNFHTVTPSNELHCTKIVAWFWIAVENMTDSERARLLQFTTGSSLLPHGGFQCLEPRFRITVYGTVGKLPIAHTCFNEICLSNHNLFEEFEKTMKTAIMEGSEGFSFN